MLEHVESSLEARHRSEQQVRQFVADASHELRTPLTTIAGYTELARQPPRRPRRRRHRARQGRGGVRPDDRAGRGPAAAGPPRLRPPAGARAGGPDPAAHRGGLRRRACSLPTTSGGSRCPTSPSRSPATSRGCTRWSPTCSPTPASTRRPAPRSRSTAHPRRLRRARRRPRLPARPRRPRPSSGSPAATSPGSAPPTAGAGGYGLGLSLVTRSSRPRRHRATALRPGDTTVSVELPA